MGTSLPLFHDAPGSCVVIWVLVLACLEMTGLRAVVWPWHGVSESPSRTLAPWHACLQESALQPKLWAAQAMAPGHGDPHPGD